MDVAGAMRNTLQQLQEEPQRYRLFGIWWPFIKAMLKRQGYGPDQLFLLGDHKCSGLAERIPRVTLPEALAAALAEYEFNATFPRPDGRVEDQDGELISVVDEDAGGL